MKLIFTVITLTVFVTWMTTCNSRGVRTPHHVTPGCPSDECPHINPKCLQAGERCIHAMCYSIRLFYNCQRERMLYNDTFEETGMVHCRGLPLGTGGPCATNVTG